MIFWNFLKFSKFSQNFSIQIFQKVWALNKQLNSNGITKKKKKNLRDDEKLAALYFSHDQIVCTQIQKVTLTNNHSVLIFSTHISDIL